jgi:hypothetical protein
MFHGVYHPAVVGSRGNLGLVICNPASVFSKSAPCDRSTIGQRERPSASARTDAERLTGTTMPDPHPPCRNAGSDCRPPTQHKRRAQELSPRLLNVDPPYPKTSFRPYQVEVRDLPRAAEEGILGSFNLSRASHRNSIRWLPRETDAEEGGWVQTFPEFHGWRWKGTLRPSTTQRFLSSHSEKSCSRSNLST